MRALEDVRVDARRRYAYRRMAHGFSRTKDRDVAVRAGEKVAITWGFNLTTLHVYEENDAALRHHEQCENIKCWMSRFAPSTS